MENVIVSFGEDSLEHLEDSNFHLKGDKIFINPSRTGERVREEKERERGGGFSGTLGVQQFPLKRG